MMKRKLGMAVPLLAIAAAMAVAFAADKATPTSKENTRMRDYVTKENGTEPPFQNEYWNNKERGIYVCVISGEPLFSSVDKFDSGTGWPSFTRPLKPEALEEIRDGSLGMVRTEVRSKKGDSHLGHVFEDGPKPTGLRYCMNSAAMRFVPVDVLEREGLGEYVRMFASKAKE